MARDTELAEVLKAMRRIGRVIDIHSRHIHREVGLTLSQLIVLGSVQRLGQSTVTAVSEASDLTPATVVGILDKLEEKKLIERHRSTSDRRIVHTRLTDQGLRVLRAAPAPLGETFERAFFKLRPTERADTIAAIARVAAFAALDTEDV